MTGDLMQEVWKDSFTYPEYFQVSNTGRIKRKGYSFLKENRSKLGKIFLHRTIVKEKILKWSILRTGYVVIWTGIENNKVRLGHKEVALTWIGEPENEDYVVDHINGMRDDNRVCNLRWVSKEDNLKNTDYERPYGKKSLRFTGTVLAYDMVTGELVAKMQGNKDMAEKGFDYRLVSAVLMGKRNSHRGCVFEKLDDGISFNESCENISKTNFKTLEFLDEHGNMVFEVQTYEELVNRGFIPHNVFRVVRGLSKTHRGYLIKVKGEY